MNSRRRPPLALRPNPDAALPEAAIVLAAGLGKRMRPLTATRPKPLVRIGGKALIDYSLDNLRRSGVGRAVVNVHYLAGQVEAHLRRAGSGIETAVSDEREALLETGGGIAKALPLIGADPFFALNSDNLWVDGPVDTLRLMAQRWDPAAMDALLLVVPLAKAHGYDGKGDFRMAADGRLARRAGPRLGPYVFSGVQLLKASLFDDVPAGAFSMNLIYDRLLAEGRLYGIAHQGQWFHVGTPQSVRDTEVLLDNG
jgi:N-acetyl-alpha-D-muramate 1-phosphate uridylyltransferase